MPRPEPQDGQLARFDPLSWSTVAVLLSGGVVGLLLYLFFKDDPPPDAAGGDVTPPEDNPDWQSRVNMRAPGDTSIIPVVHRERADGTDPRLQEFFDAWEATGPFVIGVAPKGGVRTNEAEQEQLFRDGVSKAQTLAETPHGRAGAIDVTPYYHWSNQYKDWGPFDAIGQFAKAMGLTWGGEFQHLKDGAHIEVPNWRSLPFPPGTPAPQGPQVA